MAGGKWAKQRKCSHLKQTFEKLSMSKLQEIAQLRGISHLQSREAIIDELVKVLG